MRAIYWLFVFVLVLAATLYLTRPFLPAPEVSPSSAATPGQKVNTNTNITNSPSMELLPPLSNALSRVTKKTFGLYVDPKHSPVSPERFTGFHTGVDFETFADEQRIDVSVSAICPGPLVVKEYAKGYGGVAVQRCQIKQQDVTIIYGHLRLASISKKVGDQLLAGQPFAVLGTAYSQETDGERKHLHLGIHLGVGVDIRGYVQNQAALADWLDVRQYL